MIKNYNELLKTLTMDQCLAANQNFPVARKVECIFRDYAALKHFVHDMFDFTERD